MTDPSSLADRFGSLIKLLREALAADGGRGRISLFWAIVIGTRLRRLGERFASVVARLQAGTLPAAGRGCAPGDSRPGVPRPASAPRRPRVLPRTFGWLRKLLPFGTAALLDLLQEPAMAELVAAAPQAGRVLRPLCRMLGVRRPPFLRLPRRPRAPRDGETPQPSQPPKPVRPINTRALSRLALARLLHPPREPAGFRPPDRIGYARPKPIPG